MGFGAPEARNEPIRAGFIELQRDIAAGYWSTCGRPISHQYAVECLGSEVFSEKKGAGKVTSAAQLSIGWGTICARLLDGQIACWGRASELRVGSVVTDEVAPAPIEVPALAGTLQVASGAAFSCALLNSRGVVCWGRNDKAQVGTGMSTVSALPTRVTGITDAEELALGSEHACARLRSGRVLCWGSNEYGELGIGHAAVRQPLPTEVLDLP